MRAADWIALTALTLMLAEGFALSVFPRQVQAWITTCDSRVLQNIGMCEAALATALILGMMMH